MDDNDLDKLEYNSDAQSFRAPDLTPGSGESCSKQNKAVYLLPVVFASKTGRDLNACSPVFIHNSLKVRRLVQVLLSVEI